MVYPRIRTQARLAVQSVMNHAHCRAFPLRCNWSKLDSIISVMAFMAGFPAEGIITKSRIGKDDRQHNARAYN